jgi:DNA-binding MarR family transcriptional regulator
MSEALNVGLLLFLPYRAMETRVFAGLADAGFDDFTPAQARVFQRIAADGSRLTDLAEQAGITKQSAGFLVDQLERSGYVERGPDPTDRRARLVRVAERGARSVEASRAIVAQVEAEWCAHLGPDRMARLREILTDLREITDPWRRGQSGSAAHCVSASSRPSTSGSAARSAAEHQRASVASSPARSVPPTTVQR